MSNIYPNLFFLAKKGNKKTSCPDQSYKCSSGWGKGLIGYYDFLSSLSSFSRISRNLSSNLYNKSDTKVKHARITFKIEELRTSLKEEQELMIIKVIVATARALKMLENTNFIMDYLYCEKNTYILA